jgi:glycosyltransferase involved in cell wall biosynthesis
MQPAQIKTTALVLTYNQEDYVVDAIRSVVQQTLPPHEILISDDCSTDRTFARIEAYLQALEASKGFAGRITLCRNEKNVGFIPHFNQAVEACSGDLILYNAGDDISKPERLAVLAKAYIDKGCPDYFLAHTPVQILGGDQDGGIWVPPVEQAQYTIERLANSSALHIGASQCFTKKLFTGFGPIRFNDAYEDLILGFRALLTNGYCYVPQPLIQYRVGGLTSWQKNTWEIKRKRYEAVLSQRSLDALKQGRADLQQEIFLAYQDYGFTHLPHPDRITVYSVEDTRQSLFDYSIEDHFHRLPHVIERRPLDDFITRCVEGGQPFDEKHTLVFLRVSLMGWPAVLDMLEQLQSIAVRLSIDCGIDPRVGHSLEGIPQGLARLQTYMVAHPNYTITSACPRIGQWLAERFGKAFVASPLLVDIDGPSVIRPVPSTLDPIKVLLVCDTDADNRTAPLTAMLEDIKVRHPQQRLELYIPQVMVAGLQASLVNLREGTAEFFVLKDCRRNQYEGFTYLCRIPSEIDEATANNGLLLILTRLAQSKCLLCVGSYRSGLQEDEVARNHETLRTDLYFNHSIQKQITSLIRFLGEVVQHLQYSPRLAPL